MSITDEDIRARENMPNAWRAKAKGKPVFCAQLRLWQDDVSGNVSKQWNKHYVVYASNANMSREMIEKEFCIRFVTASPHVSPLEMMNAVKESIV